MRNTLEEIQEFDELINSGKFKEAVEKWKELNLSERLTTVKGSDRISFECAHDMNHLLKNKEVRQMSSLGLMNNIRKELDSIANLEEKKNYHPKAFIDHDWEMLIIKPN